MARDPKQDGRRNPRRESTLRRRPAYRDALPTILVLCGARSTEPTYIKGLLRVVDNRAVDVQVSRLRKKLEDGPGGQELIRTIRNEGYMFTAKVTRT